jgi:hypothetical protein
MTATILLELRCLRSSRIWAVLVRSPDCGEKPPDRSLELGDRNRPRGAGKPTVGARRPGKPTDNAQCESFNGRFRQECLNSHWFFIYRRQKKIDAWWTYYNKVRPQSALKWQASAEYTRQRLAEGQNAVSNESEISTSYPD